MSAECKSVAIGVFAYNEEASIRNAVEALLDQPLGAIGPSLKAELASVTIVSCGSVDRTAAVAKELCARDARVGLLARPQREGKARAINAFLARTSADFVLLIGADVVLSRGGLASLLLPFGDPAVGMTGGRPVPQNEERGLGVLVHTLWALHDRVARHTPKLGEAIAIRAPVAPLPEWTCADEASIEADVTRRRGLRLVYCADTIVHNRGPETFTDYVAHRRRIARAHSEVSAVGYRPATRQVGAILRHAFAHAVDNRRHLGWLALAAAVEGYAWLMGYVDARGSRARSGVWAPIVSAKREVTRERSPRPARARPASPTARADAAFAPR